MTRFLARWHVRILATLAGAIVSPTLSQATNILWDGTGTTWNTSNTWSLVTSATTPNPSAQPGASDVAFFNITTVNTAQSVNLDAPQSALGLVFDSTGTVLIQSAAGGGSANSLTLGASGITHGAGAGADTISAPVILSATQTWINNSSGIFTASGGVNLAGNALTIDGAATTTFSSALSGTGGVTKNGTAALRLNASNTFTGGVTIDAGPVILSNAGALNLTTPNAVSFGSNSTGALTLNGNNVTVSGLTTNASVGSPFIENKSATPATLTVNNGSDNTYAGLLQDSAGGGALSLTKSGDATLLLSGSNTFSGGVNLDAGTLLLGSNSALGTGPLTATTTNFVAPSIGASGGARIVPNALAFTGGVGGFSVVGASDLTLSGPVTLKGTNNDIGLDGTGVTTLSGNIGQDSFPRALGIAFPGTLRLSGNNTFSGGVFIQDGSTLLIGSNSALGSSNTVTVNGGTLEADGGSRTINVSIEQGLVVDGSSDLQFSNWGVSGALSPSLTKNGTGTLTLGSGGFNGPLVINTGTVRMSGLGSSGNANLTTVTVKSPGVWDLGPSFNTVDNLVLSGGSVTMGTGALSFNNTAAVTTLASLQTATISGLLAPIGNVLGATGNLTFDVADGPAAIDLDVSATIDNNAGGLGSLTKVGAGTLRLSGTSSFTGGVTVSAGTLLVTSSSALGSGALTINGGAVDLSTFAAGVSHVNLNAGSLSMTGDITVGSGSLLGQSVAINITQSLTTSGTTTIDPGATLTVDGGALSTSAVAGSGTFSFLGGTLGITGPAGLTIGSGSKVGTNISLGAGDLLNVTNSMHIDSTGRLANPGGNVLASNLLIDAGGRWTVSDGVQSVGTGLVNHGTLVLIDTTINGPVNSPAGSTVTVVGGVTFNQLVSGAGQFFGPGTATFNGGYSPGDSPATVSFQGGVTLGAANALTIEIAGTTPGTQYDQVHVAAQLTLGGTLHVSLIGSPPALGDHYDILDWGSLSGTFPVIQLPPLSGTAWDTSQLYTTGILNVLPVRGDINRDGHVDVADISALMVALTDLPTYQGSLTSTQLAEIADLNGDGLVTNADIQGLINLLANGGGSGGGSLTAVPEPATLTLCIIGLSVVAMRRFRSHGSLNSHDFQRDFSSTRHLPPQSKPLAMQGVIESSRRPDANGTIC